MSATMWVVWVMIVMVVDCLEDSEVISSRDNDQVLTTCTSVTIPPLLLHPLTNSMMSETTTSNHTITIVIVVVVGSAIAALLIMLSNKYSYVRNWFEEHFRLQDQVLDLELQHLPLPHRQVPPVPPAPAHHCRQRTLSGHWMKDGLPQSFMD